MSFSTGGSHTRGADGQRDGAAGVIPGRGHPHAGTYTRCASPCRCVCTQCMPMQVHTRAVHACAGVYTCSATLYRYVHTQCMPIQVHTHAVHARAGAHTRSATPYRCTHMLCMPVQVCTHAVQPHTCAHTHSACPCRCVHTHVVHAPAGSAARAEQSPAQRRPMHASPQPQQPRAGQELQPVL